MRGDQLPHAAARGLASRRSASRHVQTCRIRAQLQQDGRGREVSHAQLFGDLDDSDDDDAVLAAGGAGRDRRRIAEIVAANADAAPAAPKRKKKGDAAEPKKRLKKSADEMAAMGQRLENGEKMAPFSPTEAGSTARAGARTSSTTMATRWRWRRRRTTPTTTRSTATRRSRRAGRTTSR